MLATLTHLDESKNHLSLLQRTKSKTNYYLNKKMLRSLRMGINKIRLAFFPYECSG